MLDHCTCSCTCSYTLHMFLFSVSPGCSSASWVFTYSCNILHHWSSPLSLVSDDYCDYLYSIKVSIHNTYTLMHFTYVLSSAQRKLRISTPGQLLINLSLSLMGIYMFFIIGGLVSGVQVICEINSALLHYFMLVYFGWTAAECINLYFKLVKVLGEVPLVSEHYVLKAGLIIWCKFCLYL